MVAVKRYIWGVRRPSFSGRMLRLAIVVSVLVLLLVGVRTFWLMQAEVPSDRSDLGLVAGDRVIVNRCAWGIRHAFPFIFSNTDQPMSQSLGEIVVYRHPNDETLMTIGRINAPAGRQHKYKGRYPQENSCIIDGYDVPNHLVVGRVECVTYSLDSTRVFLDQFRPQRFFLTVR
jgi:signal peptidase I